MSLNDVARALVAPGKGILAADESGGTIKKRFDTIGCDSTEDRRRAYREMLFTTKGADEFVSGVILFDETIRQNASDGRPLPKILEEQGIIPGIKVDKGAVTLAKSPNEKVTDGLDGLRDRLIEYRGLGAKFAKWRAVIDIADGIPTQYCLKVNAHALARYAALCQEEDIVPIVEPEVLMDGDHSIERCYEVTTATLHTVFNELYKQRVALDGMLLKPNMVIPGKKNSSYPAKPELIAERTVACFRNVVPAEVPGIVFLSGGQGDEEASANLSAMNKLGPHPWQLSFSYGRALQAPSLKAWKGDDANIAAGQSAYLHRAHMNGLARSGEYTATADAGLCVLVGVTHDDSAESASKLASKVANLRIFDGEQSLLDVGGAALVVSQFTLYGDTTRGRRPSWIAAARPEQAEPLVDAFVDALRTLGVRVEAGRFGANMQVALVNDGPVTLMLEA